MDPELTLNFDSLQDETDGGINNSEKPSSTYCQDRFLIPGDICLLLRILVDSSNPQSLW